MKQLEYFGNNYPLLPRQLSKLLIQRNWFDSLIEGLDFAPNHSEIQVHGQEPFGTGEGTGEGSSALYNSLGNVRILPPWGSKF